MLYRRLSFPALSYILIFTCFSITTFNNVLQAQEQALQRKNNGYPLIASGKLIEEGDRLHDEKKYVAALEKYKQVPPSDTNYVRALYEIALTYDADSQHTAALAYVEKALKIQQEFRLRPALLTQYASILDNCGQVERAHQVYDSAIKIYPTHLPLHLNKGITYLREKKYKEAETIFQQGLLINPYYSSFHFRLGVAAMEQGKNIPAMMAFMTYLLLSPSGPFKPAAIGNMDMIAKANDKILGNKEGKRAKDNQPFQFIEDIVVSKIALESRYKNKSFINDPMVRQMQVILEKLEYEGGNKTFYMQFYVPLYQMINQQKKFDPLIGQMFADVDIAEIQNYNKRNKKEIEKFANEAIAYFNSIRSTRELQYEARSDARLTYLFEEGDYVGSGKMENNNLTGKWHLTYAGGNSNAEGSFDASGKKIGTWKYYHFNGQPRGLEEYKDGKQNGKAVFYYDDGSVSYESTFLNDKLNGKLTSYFRNGAVNVAVEFVNGEMNGIRTEYYESSQLKSKETYVNGLLEGNTKTFYKSGAVEVDLNYTKGKRNGSFKAYHENGKISVEGNYKENEFDGLVTRYYENGQVKSKEIYSNGKLNGLYEEFHLNGKPFVSYQNKNGKAEGEAVYLDDDGIKFSTLTFGNGKIKTAKYFDKKGNILSENKVSGRSIEIVSYSPYGFKKAQTFYNAKENIEGIKTGYYPNGKVSEKETYTDGDLNGLVHTFFMNGKLQRELSYKAGEKDGFYTEWYAHGAKEEEGWFVDGELEGLWKNYGKDGKLVSSTNYLNGEFHGALTRYHPNGQTSQESFYKNGLIEKIIQYDTLGSVIHEVQFKNGNGKFTELDINKKLAQEGEFLYGYLHGKNNIYYPNGKIRITQYFKNGERDSIYRIFHANGQVKVAGSYAFGKQSGVWKHYNHLGVQTYQDEFVMGNSNGKRIYYFENGKVDTEIEMMNDMKHGWYKRYSPDGSLLYQIKYDFDNPLSYTYLGKDGKLVPEIAFKNLGGNLKAYHANGQISAEMTFVNGVRHGTLKLYHPSGKLFYEITDEYGISDGPSKTYLPNGEIQRSVAYLHDELHGSYVEKDVNGKLLEEGTYQNGEFHGTRKIYGKDGKLAWAELYHYGTLLTIQ